MPHNRKVKWFGRMYWRPDALRVWTHDGELVHLGAHSLAKARRVAHELGYYFINGLELDESRQRIGARAPGAQSASETSS